MLRPVRVLHVIGSMGYGGAETMIMNYYRHIDRDKVQFDFVVHTGKAAEYDQQIQRLGGRIYRTEKFNGRNYLSYRRWWRTFLREHPEYEIVHGHIGSSAAIYLAEAKKQGRYTIAHSHNTRAVAENGLRRTLWEAFSYPTRYIADYFFGCSMEAGRDRFGERVVSSERFAVMMNAIDCERFAFRQSGRERIRRQYGLTDNFVVGHVGRFSPQKNHKKLMEIFDMIHTKDDNARLLLVGGGNLRPDIEEKARKLGLEDAVIFAGLQTDTEDYYAAMDVFCFPSAWEGLGIVAVEAQANGLPCVVSDAVPALADIHAGLFETLGLERSAEAWAGVVLEHSGQPHLSDAAVCAARAGYDILAETQKLETFYLTGKPS